jgi:hypothetical protein
MRLLLAGLKNLAVDHEKGIAVKKMDVEKT